MLSLHTHCTIYYIDRERNIDPSQRHRALTAHHLHTYIINATTPPPQAVRTTETNVSIWKIFFFLFFFFIYLLIYLFIWTDGQIRSWTFICGNSRNLDDDGADIVNRRRVDGADSDVDIVSRSIAFRKQTSLPPFPSPVPETLNVSFIGR